MTGPIPPEEETQVHAGGDGPPDTPSLEAKASHRKNDASKPPENRDWKWGLKVSLKAILALLMLCILVFGLVFVLLANMHSDWVKEPVLEEVAAATGIELDYDTLSIEPFSGVEFRGLRVSTPETYSKVAPHVLQLGVLQIQWDLSSIFDGGFRISSFEIGELEVALVSDEHGQSSITRLMEGLPSGDEKEEEEPEEEKPPLQLSNILSFREMPLFELTHFSFHGFRLDQFELMNGKVVKHMALEDLGIWAEIEAGNGNLHLDFNMGSPEKSEGTRVRVEEHPDTPDSVVRKAVIFLKNAVSTPGEDGVSLDVEVDVRYQDFLEDYPSSANLLGTTMALTFHPEESRTRFHLEGLNLIEGASKTTLDVDLLDRPDGLIDPHIKELAGQASADVLMEVLAVPLPGINFNGAVADYALKDLKLDLESGTVTSGNLALSVKIADAIVDMEGQKASLDSGSFTTNVDFTGAMALKFDSTLSVDKVQFSDPTAGLDAELEKFQLSLKGHDLVINKEKPEASTGAIQMGASIGNARALVGEDEIAIDGIALQIESLLDGNPVYGARVSLPIESLEVTRAGAPLASIESLEARVDVAGLTQTLTEEIKSEVQVKLDKLHFEEAGMTADIKGFGVEVDALVRSLISADLKIKMPLESLVFSDGKGVDASLSNLMLTTSVEGQEVFLPAAPLASRINVNFGLGLGALNASIPGTRVRLEGMDLGVDTGVAPNTPIALSLKVPMSKLKIIQAGKTLIDSTNAHIHLDVTDADVNLEDPTQSDANVAWDIDLYPLTTSATLSKVGQHLDLKLNLGMDHFKPVLSALPAKGAGNNLEVPWHRLKLDLTTQLELEGLDDPANAFVKQKTAVDMRGFSVAGPGVQLKTPRIRLDVATRGSGEVQKANVKLLLAELGLNGREYGEDLELTLTADVNPFRSKADTRLEVKAPLDFYVLLENGVNFKSSNKKVSYNNRLVLKNLDFIKENLPPQLAEAVQLDWKNIEIDVTNEGGFSGLFKSMKQFQPTPQEDPLKAITGNHRTEISIRGIDLVAQNSILKMPSLTFDLNLTAQQGELDGNLDFALPRLFAHPNGVRKPLEVDGLNFKTALRTEGGVLDGTMFVTAAMDLGRLIHNKVEGYGVENLVFKSDVVVEQLNRLNVRELFFSNPAGGTELRLSGIVDGLDPNRVELDEFGIPGRQNVLLEGQLKQDLDPVTINADAMTSRGQISLPFKLSSGDMRVFRFAGELTAEQLGVDIPDDGIALVGFNGRVPLVQDIAIAEDGVTLLPGPSKNLYSRKQFSDVQPFLKTDNFISVERLDFMGQTMSPIAGNLRIEKDQFALDQLQIGFRGGNIFGQVVVDYEGGNPKVFFKGNVTGIRPSESEDVLDANATLSLEPMTLKLDGRVQVVRIGQQHLLDMIDLLDPYREDVNMNRARMGLEIGYPKFMRMRMQHGFMAVKLELGGAASAIRIDEIRGIALGPFLNTYVAPVLAGGE